MGSPADQAPDFAELATIAAIVPITMVTTFVILAVVCRLNVAIIRLFCGVVETSRGPGVRRPRFPFTRRTFSRSWRRSPTATAGIALRYAAAATCAACLAALVGMLGAGHTFAATGARPQLVELIVGDDDLTQNLNFMLWAGVLNVAVMVYGARFSAGMTRDSPNPRSPHVRLRGHPIPLVARHRFLTEFYLYKQLHWARVISLLIAASQAHAVLITVDYTDSQDKWSSADSVTASVLIGFTLAFGVSRAVQKAVDVALPSARAAWLVHRCLVGDETQGSGTSGNDRVRSARKHLSETARALRRSGARLDMAAPSHPTATVVLASAARLREYLAQARSLVADYPDDVRDILRNSITLIAGPPGAAFVAAAGRGVHAFDRGGAPEAALRQRSAGWWSGVFGRLVEAVEPYARLGNAAWAIFTVVVVGILLSTGALDIGKFQLQK